MDLDKAFLRRMPVTVKTPVPDAASRRDILAKMLSHHQLTDDVDVEEIARRTADFTGSDLRGLQANRQKPCTETILSAPNRIKVEIRYGYLFNIFWYLLCLSLNLFREFRCIRKEVGQCANCGTAHGVGVLFCLASSVPRIGARSIIASQQSDDAVPQEPASRVAEGGSSRTIRTTWCCRFRTRAEQDEKDR